MESESIALPLGDIPVWGERWDSNPRQPVPQTGALPTELRSPYLTTKIKIQLLIFKD